MNGFFRILDWRCWRWCALIPDLFAATNTKFLNEQWLHCLAKWWAKREEPFKLAWRTALILSSSSSNRFLLILPALSSFPSSSTNRKKHIRMQWNYAQQKCKKLTNQATWVSSIQLQDARCLPLPISQFFLDSEPPFAINYQKTQPTSSVRPFHTISWILNFPNTKKYLF
jgi:hypothetical protein